MKTRTYAIEGQRLDGTVYVAGQAPHYYWTHDVKVALKDDVSKLAAVKAEIIQRLKDSRSTLQDLRVIVAVDSIQIVSF